MENNYYTGYYTGSLANCCNWILIVIHAWAARPPDPGAQRAGAGQRGPRGRQQGAAEADVGHRAVPAQRHREARLPRRLHGEAPAQDRGRRTLPSGRRRS